MEDKAKQRALERFPVHEGASKEWIESHLKGICSDYIEGYRQAEKDLTDKAKLSSGCDGFYYGQGYKQAEKDLELTWEDIDLILDITDQIANDDSMVEKLNNMSQEKYCTEVLKRFKAQKG